MSRPLDALVETSRFLPWPGLRAPAHPLAVRMEPVRPDGALGQAVRERLAAFLSALAARIEPVLLEALARASRAWDQVDAADVLDDELRAEAAGLRAACDEAGGGEAWLARATLDAALSVTALVERRLATLVRLRARSQTPELLLRGRPFLDVARALAEVARRWA